MNEQRWLSVLPIGAIALLIAGLSWQQWQAAQAKRPDYDHPERAFVQAPLGLEAGQSQQAEVLSVQDGESLTIRSGLFGERIRLCGIDALELDKPAGQASRDNLQRLIDQAGGTVTVVPLQRDIQGHRIAEVYVPAANPSQPGEERLLSYEQLAAGMASLHPFAHDCPNGDVLEQAEAR